jgi:hypothetical protein
MYFPMFGGFNPKLWKSRCETYFEYGAVPLDMWIKIAVMHFEGCVPFAGCNLWKLEQGI